MRLVGGPKGLGWSTGSGGAAVARLKKEGGGEATDERARAVSGVRRGRGDALAAWAEWVRVEAGPSGDEAGSAREGNKLGLGLLWAGIWGWLGGVPFPFLFFFSLKLNYLNLKEKNFEFKPL